MSFVRKLTHSGDGAFWGSSCLASTTSLQAQTTSATVFGSVQDSQGGSLPGATVTLTSRTQGNALTATTDAEGRFVFPIVRPDSYTLRVTHAGLQDRRADQRGGERERQFSAGVITLEVGGIEESVSVSGRVSELQTTSGERSFTLESEALKNIANNGRSMFTFATLVPGVVYEPEQRRRPGQAADLSVNGQRPNSNNMTIDGVANIDTGNNGGNMVTTNIDAVAEFKILTNSYQAEYGRAVGGQVQVVTKSGTQAFHGSGYWYGRRSDWNANSWTNKRAGRPPPVGNGEVIELPDASRNDYGYTLGGPIFIPGVFNEDKKKLFFFWSQEFQRRTDPVEPSGRPACRPRSSGPGDFSQSVDASGNPFPYIRDYTTGLPCSSGEHRGCFADGGVLGRIPASRLYAPGIAALNIYPDVELHARAAASTTRARPRPRRRGARTCCGWTSRPRDKWRFTGRYMKTKEDIIQPYGTTWAGNGSDQLPTPDALPAPRVATTCCRPPAS